MNASIPAPGHPPLLAGRRVLLTEDDVSLNHMLTLALTEAGMAVESTFGCRAATAAIRDKTLDFCLFDYQLPDGNGLDLLQELRVRQPALPVLIMSANRDSQLVSRAAALHAEGFLEKPVRLDELEKIIAAAIRRGAPASAFTL